VERSGAWTRPQPPSWFRAVSTIFCTLIVVTDTRPGSADDLGLCSWAIALTAATPAGILLIVGPHRPFPHLLGRGMGRLNPRTPYPALRRPLCLVSNFSAIFTAHSTLRAHPSRAQHPLLMAALLSPGAVTSSCPLSSPFTLHTSHPTSHLCNTPWGTALQVCPLPLPDYPTHARGDLPLGAASCVSES